MLYISCHSEASLIHDNLCDNFKKNASIQLKVLCAEPNLLSFFDKVSQKLKLHNDSLGINKAILLELSQSRYDVVFVCKGNNIHVSTLRKIRAQWPKCLLVSYSGDNMHKWHNKSLFYHFGMKYYQLIFSVDIPAYRKIENFHTGFAKIIYLDKSYSSYVHRPLSTKRCTFKYNVIFIGTYEKERMDFMNFLAENGIQIDIFGGRWDRLKNKEIHKNLSIHYRELTGSAYVNAIFYSKITLGFLRKLNEDTQTSRSFEIPACGGFMMMERTAEHLRLFDEGLEAEFFDSKEELLEKIKYYLANTKIREKIALNGRRRCMKSPYSFQDRVTRILFEIENYQCH
jgi:spore maturation protein CgeB